MPRLPMSTLPIRRWTLRLRQLPLAAGGWLSKQFHRLPARQRTILLSVLLILPTTFLCSHFPLTIVPDYRPGQRAVADLAVPADLQADSLDYFSAELPPVVSEKLKQTRIVLRAGDVVTDDVLPQLQAIRQYQLTQRQPRRLVG